MVKTSTAVTERRSRQRKADRKSDDVHQLARRHVSDGGGIWIADEPDVYTPIGIIARRHLAGRAREKELEGVLVGLTCEQVDIVWEVVNTWNEAAFALGAAVGIELARNGLPR